MLTFLFEAKGEGGGQALRLDVFVLLLTALVIQLLLLPESHHATEAALPSSFWLRFLTLLLIGWI